MGARLLAVFDLKKRGVRKDAGGRAFLARAADGRGVQSTPVALIMAGPAQTVEKIS
ncbi:hypothetical protein ZHAS_00018303 [Anopheles sinensis]|uniref:Uncharacterized protein n=1 Tax=Anopheles sinensis TaxID=74873 RepID=A0A084WHL6_ANOSI|nr:hypothetical protein ZHAS_00018303 [Anopheles sinensis]